MIEYLEGIDQSLVLTINGWNTPFLDEFMWIVSGRLTWVPLYVFLVYLAVRKAGWKSGLLFLFGVAITVILADFISTRWMKEVIQRYRPSHNILLQDQLHYYRIAANDFYRGGTYGFVSSHAANFFAIAIFSMAYLKEYKKWLYPMMLFVAVLVAFSRIYLGVHYPSDVFVGGLLGAVLALLLYRYVFRNSLQKLEVT